MRLAWRCSSWDWPRTTQACYLGLLPRSRRTPNPYPLTRTPGPSPYPSPYPWPGMLPLEKALVESLFQDNLLRVVFATETLAAGMLPSYHPSHSRLRRRYQTAPPSSTPLRVT